MADAMALQMLPYQTLVKWAMSNGLPGNLKVSVILRIVIMFVHVVIIIIAFFDAKSVR